MSKPTAVRNAAREACEKFPDTPSRTLARMLHEQRPKLFPSLENARGAIRVVRGNIGSKNRKEVSDKSLFRPNGKAGQVTMPEPLTKPYTRHWIAGPTKVLNLSDIHIPFHCPNSLKLAVAEGRRRKCDTILINGDLFDFYQGSIFEQNPEHRDMVVELRMGVKFLLWLRSQFPKARMIFKEGNHDERWSRTIWRNAPVLWQLPQMHLPGVLGYQLADETDNKSVKFEDYGWEHVAEKRIVMAGRLAVFHGHELPRGISSPVNPARGLYLKIKSTGIMGHCHQTSMHAESDVDRREVVCWSQGCLSDLTPEYARVNRFNSGFSIIEVANNGEFDVHNFRIAEGKVRAS